MNIRTIIFSITVSFVFVSLLLSSVSFAKPSRDEAQAADERLMLLNVVKKGDNLWHDPKLGNNGLACANCHPDGSASNPHTFPKYQSNLGKVGTLSEMINWCKTVVLQGSPLASDSEEMTALEAYSFYTHRGVAIAPAADEQHGAVPVLAGPGYPVQ